MEDKEKSASLKLITSYRAIRKSSVGKMLSVPARETELNSQHPCKQFSIWYSLMTLALGSGDRRISGVCRLASVAEWMNSISL